MLCSHREILYTHDNAFSRAIGDNVTESHKYNFEEKKCITIIVSIIYGGLTVYLKLISIAFVSIISSNFNHKVF